jgi:hypothetical protein
MTSFVFVVLVGSRVIHSRDPPTCNVLRPLECGRAIAAGLAHVHHRTVRIFLEFDGRHFVGSPLTVRLNWR